MNQQEAKQLIDKYLKGIATESERRLIEAWYNKRSAENMLTDDNDFEHLSKELWDKTLQRAGLKKPNAVRRLWPAIAVAASLTLFVLAGILFFLNKKDAETVVVNKTEVEQKISPGGNKAVLTLANGKQINLTDQKNGKIVNENNALISKNADGEVMYETAAKANSAEQNTLITPRGGQYTLILSDGTKVTLNAESSLKFPVGFTGNARVVELTGEAYFEVAHNTKMPFRVVSRGQTIEVLGTHFNINCYNDEPAVKTTLLEGSVRVITASQTALLKPGQQAQSGLTGKAGQLTIGAVNVAEAVAWKNGIFEFNEASVNDVMRMVARWYDIDVSYSGKTSDVQISGKISRKVDFSGIVKLMEFEGVKFKIAGKKVEVITMD